MKNKKTILAIIILGIIINILTIFWAPTENNMLKKVVICIVVNIILLFFMKFVEYFVSFGKEVIGNHKLIRRLAKNDFKTKFAGSYLGIIWAFVQPVVTVLVYWFVFQVGLRSGNVGEFPFVLWLVAGLVPWFFFSDALNSGTNALLEYNYLVKKVVFKITIIPVVKVISAMFVHAFFAMFTLLLYALYGYLPDLYTLQVLYYSFCIFIFVLGLSYMTSAIVVFFRDLTQIINIILQVGVWMTPIMWNLSMVPARFLWIFKLNPMYYIVAGYRSALIDKTWFWETYYLTGYFWAVTLAMFGVGVLLFKRLKVHFADVL
jgi:ABC-type polysaccharide/polyol phosphate export systems, permease component